jgi:hypothetical protein
MSVILKELADLKGCYFGEFEFDSIPRYFPPTHVPEAPYLIKSWQEKEGYTDVYISGKLGGLPGKREIGNLFLCYKPFADIVQPEIEEKLERIWQGVSFPISVEVTPHYKYFEKPGPGVFVQQTNEDTVPINTMIEFLEKVEKLLVENISITFSKLKKER